jgi:glycosyltransferase involved in cell wall biosynthesis
MISIIINCHNGSRYLRETLQSIINQDYNNYEVIFWNNNSTDESKDIYQNFQKLYKDKNLRYFENLSEIPLYQARNEALKLVKGNFICFLDSDDIWLKNKLFQNLKKFKENNYDIVFSNIFILNQKSNKKEIYIKKNIYEEKIYESLINNFNASLISIMIKKSVIEKENSLFNPEFDHIGDFDFILRMSKKYKFGYISEPLAVYRLHENNLTRLNRLNEINEMESWINRNVLGLDHQEIQPIRNKSLERKFIYYKINGEILNSFSIFLKISLRLKIKLFILFFLPKRILERILSF